MLWAMRCQISQSAFLLSVKNKGNGRSLKLLTTHIKSPSLWPIWLFIVANTVFSCGRCGCGQYGLWPKWSVADMVQSRINMHLHEVSRPQHPQSDWRPRFGYNAYILLILLCGANTRCMTSVSSRHLDAFHQCASATFYGFRTQPT